MPEVPNLLQLVVGIKQEHLKRRGEEYVTRFFHNDQVVDELDGHVLRWGEGSGADHQLHGGKEIT